MTNTYKLVNIGQAVEIGTTLSRSWFRGHSKVYGELTPGIFRSKYLNGMYDFYKPDAEFSVIEGFKRKASALTSNLPPYEDYLSWLFLMQHFGAPTRLLDWSKSVLIALYFVACKQHSEDGELWALYPESLNQYNGYFGLPNPRCQILRYLAAEPNHNNPQKLAEEFGLEKIPQYPHAVDPPLHFSRMVTQLSAFTIHPKPKPSQTIPEVVTEENHLVKYIIPASSKKKLLDDLAALGITKMTLFQDLDSLSYDIIQELNILLYSPPKPPRWE